MTSGEGDVAIPPLVGPEVTAGPDVTRIMRTARHRRVRNRAAAGLVAACLGGGVVALAVSDGSDPDHLELLGPSTSVTTLPSSSVTDDRDTDADAETSTSVPDNEAPSTTPQSTASETETAPPRPTTTEPTTTTVTTSTTVPDTTPYDVVIDLPGTWDTEGWPYPASPPYILVGDPSMTRGNDSDGAGCVWLEDEAGTRISILWQAGWTARLRGEGTGQPHVSVRDRQGKVQATNDDRVAIIGGEVDKPIPYCDVGEKVFEITKLSRYKP